MISYLEGKLLAKSDDRIVVLSSAACEGVWVSEW